jgi:hypothetical protein
LGIAISFRSPPTLTDTPASATEPPELATMLTNAGRAYDLSVTDASSSAMSGDTFLSELPQSMGQGVGGTLGPVSYVASGRLVGRAVKIDRPGQANARMRVFVTHRWLYKIVPSRASARTIRRSRPSWPPSAGSAASRAGRISPSGRAESPPRVGA